MSVKEFNFDGHDDEQKYYTHEPYERETYNRDNRVEPKGSPKEILPKIGDPGRYDSRDYQDSVEIEDTIDISFQEEIREKLVPGFKLIDGAVKNYFSGIRVPVSNSEENYRIMNVKISGGEPSMLIFADNNTQKGRVTLPALAITRASEEYDANRYSRPEFAVARRYNNDLRKVELISRPAPFNLDYQLDIWVEHQLELEYVTHSILSRFNPIASFYIADQGVTYEVVLNLTSSNNTVDTENDSDARTNFRKTIGISAEGWLPLTTKVVPVILSKPISVREGIFSSNSEIKYPGETYFVARDTIIPQ